MTEFQDSEPHSRSGAAPARQATSERKLRPRVLWVTNMVPPYRRPVWEELAKDTKLVVALLESKQTTARDESRNVRGSDWRQGIIERASIVTVRAIQVTVEAIDARFYLIVDSRVVPLVRSADVVVLGGWESPAYWQTLALCLIFRKPTVGFYESVTASSLFSKGPVAWARARYFQLVNRVVVPGESSSRAISGMGVPDARVLVGFNAVDVRAFARAERGVLASSDPAVGHTFAYVGRLISLKRIEMIISAFAQIAASSDTLEVIGMGPLETTLMKFAATLGISGQVRFHGYVLNHELPRVLAGIDTLVLASEREVWGLVVNEALAAGCHVVVTENCGCADSVRRMRGVYLAQPSGTDLGEKLVESRADWTGPVPNPEILAYTPATFASVFLRAIDDCMSL